MLTYKDGVISIVGNGCVVTKDCSPKFPNWTYNMYQADPYIKFLEPMTCQECDHKNIPEEGKIVEEKFDGHRSLCYITDNSNRFFSRRISKKTGWYAENTDCVPHLRDYSGFKNIIGTVLDGEITMPTGEFSDVQGVTGALPATALEKQRTCGFAIYNVFDVIYYKGINIQAMPLWKRKIYLHLIFIQNWLPNFVEVPYYSIDSTADRFVQLKDKDKTGKYYIYEPVPKIISSFKDFLEKKWEEGKEGLVVKDMYGKYEQKRSKLFLKLKKTKTYDVVIMGYQAPTREYSGKTPETWEYWEGRSSGVPLKSNFVRGSDAVPVTKPHAMGWVGAIDCGVYKDGKLVKVAEVKGITDKDQEYIKAHRNELIGTCIEIKAQGIIDLETGSLRHPRFSRFRPDKNGGGEDCKWEDYVLVG